MVPPPLSYGVLVISTHWGCAAQVWPLLDEVVSLPHAGGTFRYDSRAASGKIFQDHRGTKAFQAGSRLPEWEPEHKAARRLCPAPHMVTSHPHLQMGQSFPSSVLQQNNHLHKTNSSFFRPLHYINLVAFVIALLHNVTTYWLMTNFLELWWFIS